MFSFESLTVYKKAQSQNLKILDFLKSSGNLDPFIRDQFKRASLSIILILQREKEEKERKKLFPDCFQKFII